MDPQQIQWQRLARRIDAKIRLGRIVQSSLPLVLLFGLFLLGLGIATRLNGWGWAWSIHGGVISGVVLILGSPLLIALLWTRETDGAGFARLDCTLRLNNALSAAAAGRGKWPALPPNSDDMLRFKWFRIISPCAVCILLAAAGLFIPLPVEAVGTHPTPPPRLHTEIAALIAELEKVDAINRADIEKLEQQLSEIRNQPAENWYSHSSLEAADHLQNGLQNQLRALEHGLNMAVSSLSSLEKLDESLSSVEQQRLAGEFQSAVQGLKNASPGLNQKLVDSLSSMDPAKLKSLNSGEFHTMLEQMKDAATACKNCQGPGGGGKDGRDGAAQSELDELLGPGERLGEVPQDGAGRPDPGGVQRGPGVASLPMSRDPTDLATDNPDFLYAEDFGRTRPGDAIGILDTKHNLEKNPVGLQAGGSAGAGQGGQAVSKDTLLPAEKAILRSYFR